MKAWVKYEEKNEKEGTFTIEPLTKGLGLTIGNSLRRVLLSSLEGLGLNAIRISGINHEFSTLPNVVEDVIEIICNLKQINFQSNTSEPLDKPAILKLDKKNTYKAKDIICPDGLTILNKDVYLLEVTDNINVEIELFVNKGIGFKDSSQSSSDNDSIDLINLDTSYSPIVKVNHEVNLIRVGKELDHDSLTLHVETNGNKGPLTSVNEAVSILSDHLALFSKINEKPEQDKTEESNLEDLKTQAILKMSVDELELSARSSNCLKRAGIKDVNELISKDMAELEKIKNFGKKSADEINNKLKQYNLSIKGSSNES